jgi:activator of HSP90 ATPase
MKTKSVKQVANFRTTPHEVYEALIDEVKHAAFTGGRANIRRCAGGTFSIFDGHAEGVTEELVADRKIVQTWRASDWPEGHYSRVTFELSQVPGGTRLAFTQEGVPEEHCESIEQGWRDHYWAPMKQMLEK